MDWNSNDIFNSRTIMRKLLTILFIFICAVSYSQDDLSAFTNYPRTFPQGSRQFITNIWNIKNKSGSNYLDSAIHHNNASSISIVSGDDGIKLNIDSALVATLRLTGGGEVLMNYKDTGINVLIADIPYNINNQLFCNGTYLVLCSESLKAEHLNNVVKWLWPVFNSTALALIDSIGGLSILQKTRINGLWTDFDAINPNLKTLFAGMWGLEGNNFQHAGVNWINTTKNHLTVQDSIVNFYNGIIQFNGKFCVNTNLYPSDYTQADSNCIIYYSPYNLYVANTGSFNYVYSDFSFYTTALRGGFGLSISTRDTTASNDLIDQYTATGTLSKVQIKGSGSTKGSYIVNKVNNDLKLYINGNQNGGTTTNVTGSVNPKTFPIILGGYSINGVTVSAVNYSFIPCSFFAFGKNIPAANIPLIHHALKKFNDSKYYSTDISELNPN